MRSLPTGAISEFVDDRVSAAQRVAFVHTLLRRDMAEARLFLYPIERTLDARSATDRAAVPVEQALAGIAGDGATRERFVNYMRNVDDAELRARMIAVGARLGWLSASQQGAEWTRMVEDRMRAANLGARDVDVICRSSGGRGVDPAVAAS